MTARIPTLDDMERRGLPASLRLGSSRRRDPDPEPVAPIGAGATVTRAELTPGRVVERWTEPTRAGVRVPLPCHEAQRVTVDPERAAGVAVVVCRVCSESYDLELSADSDGGHFARFTVAHRPYLLSRAAR